MKFTSTLERLLEDFPLKLPEWRLLILVTDMDSAPLCIFDIDGALNLEKQSWKSSWTKKRKIPRSQKFEKRKIEFFCEIRNLAAYSNRKSKGEYLLEMNVEILFTINLTPYRWKCK